MSPSCSEALAHTAPEAQPAEPTPPVERSELAPPKDEPVTPKGYHPTRRRRRRQNRLRNPNRCRHLSRSTPPTVPEPTLPKNPLLRCRPEARRAFASSQEARDDPGASCAQAGHRRQGCGSEASGGAAKACEIGGKRPYPDRLGPLTPARIAGARAGRASWESELAAHIRRYATYSANGSRESGTVRVGVTIDRNGRLLSHRLAGSSGSSTLDGAAMTVIERAQPFPRFLPRDQPGPDSTHDPAAPEATIDGRDQRRPWRQP